jgi:hypothetical protein
LGQHKFKGNNNGHKINHAGNILDENDKAANMLKCGVDKSPAVVAEIAERVKDETLVRQPYWI